MPTGANSYHRSNSLKITAPIELENPNTAPSFLRPQIAPFMNERGESRFLKNELLIRELIFSPKDAPKILELGALVHLSKLPLIWPQSPF